MTPAELVAACNARQREVEASPVSVVFSEHKAQALAVVALVRGVAERHELRPNSDGEDVCDLCSVSEPTGMWSYDESWPCPDFERAVAVAEGWRR